MEETASRYVFRASAAPLVGVAPGLRWKEAHMLEGMIVRYQERGPHAVAHDWCETGHTAFIVSGQLRYEFADHSVAVGPGDIVHIPAGPAHRHRPHVEGGETSGILSPSSGKPQVCEVVVAPLAGPTRMPVAPAIWSRRLTTSSLGPGGAWPRFAAPAHATAAPPGFTTWSPL